MSKEVYIPELDMDTTEIDATAAYIKEQKMKLIGILVDKLSPERADGYTTWRDLGLLLNNISKSKKMFDIWNNFSKKS